MKIEIVKLKLSLAREAIDRALAEIEAGHDNAACEQCNEASAYANEAYEAAKI